MKKNIIMLVGPTAVGKTELSIKIAKKLRTEIISADSRQIYKKLNIGTSKPSIEERQNIKHHLIDCIPIENHYTTGNFIEDADKLCKKIFEKNNFVIMAGGTGLYINSFCYGLDAIPGINTEIRNTINIELKKKGLKNLLNELKQKDIDYYNIVDKKNSRRIIRALEVCRTTKKPYSKFINTKKPKRYRNLNKYNFIKIGLMKNRDLLYNKINKRVDTMILQGLIEEVNFLKKYRTFNAFQTIGYKEILDYLDNKVDLTSSIELIKRNTRRYAKRQITWFKKDEEIKWFNPKELEGIFQHIYKNLTY